jgi:hypothetical protein
MGTNMTSPVLQPRIGSARLFQDVFVASGKWFRREPRKNPPLASSAVGARGNPARGAASLPFGARPHLFAMTYRLVGRRMAWPQHHGRRRSLANPVMMIVKSPPATLGGLKIRPAPDVVNLKAARGDLTLARPIGLGASPLSLWTAWGHRASPPS